MNDWFDRQWALNLVPASLPQYVDDGQVNHDVRSLPRSQLAALGWREVLFDPPEQLLGYASPVEETRGGEPYAVAYAIATPEQEALHLLAITNKSTWASQAAARKDREAKAALALPDSDDPEILRRKLNAALHLLSR